MKKPPRPSVGEVSLGLVIGLFLAALLVLLASSLGLQAVDATGHVLKTWDLASSVFERAGVEAWQSEHAPQSQLVLAVHLVPGTASSLLASLAILVAALAVALPLGFGTALYLGHFAKRSRLRNLATGMLDFVADLPPIVIGLVVFGVFSRAGGQAEATFWAWFSAALVVALYLVPAVVRAVEVGIESVPLELRHAAQALGVGPWPVLRDRMLPEAAPVIIPGILNACARVVGDAAIMILIGSTIRTLPIDIVDLARQPEAGSMGPAAASALLLVLVMLGFRVAARIIGKNYIGARTAKPPYKQGIPGWM